MKTNHVNLPGVNKAAELSGRVTSNLVRTAVLIVNEHIQFTLLKEINSQ